MAKYKLLFLSLIVSSALFAQEEYNYKFRIMLKDKGQTDFSIDRPQDFLSEKAIDRRIRQDIPIDESDLPISEDYISEVEALGCKVIARSKWMSSVSIHCSDSNLIEQVKELGFVDDVFFVWRGTPVDPPKKKVSAKKALDKAPGYYGPAYEQIAMHNGHLLHEDEYRGEGMEIAVIDGGFGGFNDNLLLSNVSILGTKDFVYQGTSMFEGNDHGVSVLSTMAGNIPDTYVGTAPKAKYWLIRSEDPRTEFPIEGDYWAAAAEYADSIGVDLINTSLGYSRYDWPAESLTRDMLDGETVYISRAATMAVSKGILVVTSAGNEGDKEWEKVSPPADSDLVLTVGAVKKDSTLATFSSRGPTADGRIKPDVMAVGQQAVLINGPGNIIASNGTSFSAPIMCGLAACLWQAYPEFTNIQLADIIRQSANRYDDPDNNFGYGIPDMQKAREIADSYLGMSSYVSDKKEFDIIADSSGHIRIRNNIHEKNNCTVNIYSADGRLILTDVLEGYEKSYDISSVKGSVYIVYVNFGRYARSQKIIL